MCISEWQHIHVAEYIWEDKCVSYKTYNIYFQFINYEKDFNILDVCMYKKYIMFYIKVLM